MENVAPKWDDASCATPIHEFDLSTGQPKSTYAFCSTEDLDIKSLTRDSAGTFYFGYGDQIAMTTNATEYADVAVSGAADAGNADTATSENAFMVAGSNDVIFFGDGNALKSYQGGTITDMHTFAQNEEIVDLWVDHNNDVFVNTVNPDLNNGGQVYKLIISYADGVALSSAAPFFTGVNDFGFTFRLALDSNNRIMYLHSYSPFGNQNGLLRWKMP